MAHIEDKCKNLTLGNFGGQSNTTYNGLTKTGKEKYCHEIYSTLDIFLVFSSYFSLTSKSRVKVKGMVVF